MINNSHSRLPALLAAGKRHSGLSGVCPVGNQTDSGRTAFAGMTEILRFNL